jgi:hypothetical protein
MEMDIHDNDANATTGSGDIRVDDLVEGAQKLKAEAPSKPKFDPFKPPKMKAPQTKEQRLQEATQGMKINIGGSEMSADDVLAAAAALQQKMAREASGARLDLNAAAQVMNMKNLKTKDGNLDFEKMTEEAAYDLDVPIVAKPFSTEDSLNVDLKDKNYEPRWVNVNPIRLGSMRSKGFEYITADDLATPLNIEVEVDAQGHYRLNDVVAMRIRKDRYYGALRAAHLRAISAVSATGAHKAAVSAANQYMEKEAGGEYVDYASQGKVRFYQTGGQ